MRVASAASHSRARVLIPLVCAVACVSPTTSAGDGSYGIGSPQYT